MFNGLLGVLEENHRKDRRNRYNCRFPIRILFVWRMIVNLFSFLCSRVFHPMASYILLWLTYAESGWLLALYFLGPWPGSHHSPGARERQYLSIVWRPMFCCAVWIKPAFKKSCFLFLDKGLAQWNHIMYVWMWVYEYKYICNAMIYMLHHILWYLFGL